LALGADTIIALPGATGRVGAAAYVDLVRVDPGEAATTPMRVAQDPNYLTQYRIALINGQVIFAWLDEGLGSRSAPVTEARIGLASVAP
jgi:hypothetical protein